MDVETWRPIPGLETSYEVSDRGNVRSLARFVTRRSRRYSEGSCQKSVRACVLKQSLSSKGYPCVDIEQKQRRVHVLVLEAFVGPRPKGMLSLHGDGNKRNNILSNLRWGTPKENIEDAISHGVWAHGESTAQAKLTEKDVLEIRNSRETLKAFADRLGVTQTTICDARNRKTWRHLP